MWKAGFPDDNAVLAYVEEQVCSSDHGVILKVGSFTQGKARGKLFIMVHVGGSRETADPSDAKFLNDPSLVAGESDFRHVQGSLGTSEDTGY